MYQSHAPVPVQAFVVMSIKEMHFRSAGAHVRVSAEKLEQSACSTLLDADDDDVRQTPPSQWRHSRPSIRVIRPSTTLMMIGRSSAVFLHARTHARRIHGLWSRDLSAAAACHWCVTRASHCNCTSIGRQSAISPYTRLRCFYIHGVHSEFLNWSSMVKVVWQKDASLPHMQPSSQAKRDLDRFSRFCMAHNRDRPTNRQTTLYSVCITIGRMHQCQSYYRTAALKLIVSATRCQCKRVLLLVYKQSKGQLFIWERQAPPRKVMKNNINW